MKNHRLVYAVLVSGFFLLPLAAQARFQSLDINSKDTLLFQAVVSAPEFGEYTTAFSADVPSKSISQLSFFPERFTYLAASDEIQVQNRFGVYRGKNGKLEPVKGISGFLNGGEIKSGKLGSAEASPDGKYMLYLRDSSPAYGELILFEVATGTETVISSQVELDLDRTPASWSPDSSLFVYQKANRLYYFSLSQFGGGRVLPENLRAVGAGQMSSVRWGSRNQLYYVSGSLVYQILGAELFTRSLYQDFLKIGSIIGRLPSPFDPNFDSFWIGPGGTKILLNKGGSSLSVYVLGTDDYASDGQAIELPYLFLPRNTEVADVVWPSSDLITILTRVHGPKSVDSSVVYRLDARPGKSNYSFAKLEGSDIFDLVLDPDESRIAVLRPSGIQIRAYETWTPVLTIPLNSPLHLVFADSRQILVAGRYYSERISWDESKPSAQALDRNFLFFSQIENIGFDKETGLPSAKSADRVMSLDNGVWSPRSPFAVRDASASNDSYRTYLETLYSGLYQNLVMVRKSQEVGTFALFSPPKSAFEDFPPVTAADAVNFDNFTHGSRERTRQISLTFNCIDSTEGLSETLATLKDYNLRATFFVNGEFIRRFPGAVKEIADAGQEVGSLFYLYFNLSDAKYQISKDFIKQGLARNEDDYFAATGKELSLLWRSPYYIVNDDIIQAGKELNYTLVGKDVDALDYVTKGQDTGNTSLYYPSSKLVELVLDQKKPGSVVALTIGRPGADDNSSLVREDYLFSKLDLLINNLLTRGYSIVPVSSLIEAAR